MVAEGAPAQATARGRVVVLAGAGGAMNLGSCECSSCDAVTVATFAPSSLWPNVATVAESISLAALRAGWLYYYPTGSWSCPACVARSDHGGAEYRAAARRMVDRVRRALQP